MTMTIDLTQSEEGRLTEVARQRGAAPEEFVKKLIQAQLAESAGPNEAALAALRDIAEWKKEMPETDGSETDQQIRKGRAGAIYGF